MKFQRGLATATLCAICLVFTGIMTGCEEDDGDSRDASQSVNYDKTSRVVSANDPIGRQAGDLREWVMENGWIVIATTETTIQHQRESCSGFSDGDVYGVGSGTTITWEYTEPEADYPNKIVRPYLVQIYRDECLNPDPEPEPDPVIVFTNCPSCP